MVTSLRAFTHVISQLEPLGHHGPTSLWGKLGPRWPRGLAGYINLFHYATNKNKAFVFKHLLLP